MRVIVRIGTEEYAFDDVERGTTVEEIAERAGAPDGATLLLNGSRAEVGETLRDGDVVSVSQKASKLG